MHHAVLRQVAAAFAALAVLVGHGWSQSQSHVVVPAAATTTEGSSSTLWAGLATAARRQLVLDRQLLSAYAGQDLVALALRRDGDEAGLTRAGSLWLEVSVSNTLVASDRASPAFAANRGTDHRIVYQGYVAFPVTAPPAATPAPWQLPYMVSIPFAQPFRYAGGALLIETLTLRKNPQDTVTPVAPRFLVDAVTRAPSGAMLRYGRSCIAGMDDEAAGAMVATLALGSTARLNLKGTRASGLAVLLLGTARSDQPLDNLGAPGCTLHTTWIFMQPAPITGLPAIPQGIALANLPLPSLTSLAGAHLHLQWMVVDPLANALGLAFSNGVDVTLGQQHDLGVAWVESFEPLAATGHVYTDETPVLRLTFERR